MLAFAAGSLGYQPISASHNGIILSATYRILLWRIDVSAQVFYEHDEYNSTRIDTQSSFGQETMQQ